MKNQSGKVLVACNADPSGNPRPKRIIELCKSKGYIVDVISSPVKGYLEFDKHYSLPEKPKERYFKRLLRKLICSGYLKIRRYIPEKSLKNYLFNYCNNFNSIKNVIGNGYDMIIVEDLDFLPVVSHFKGSARLIFDAREYYPAQKLGIDERETYTINWICRNFLPKCDVVLTVSDGLANLYKKEFGIDTVLFRSLPNYTEFEPTPVKKDHIRIVHHGSAESRRKIENLIDICNQLDERFSLDMYLFTGNKKNRIEYLEKLKNIAAKSPRIRFLDPVPFNEIIPTINNYDIGLYFLEPNILNHQYSLPNKFFEFIQGRVMIAIGPSPDMAALVKEHKLGIVSDNFNTEELARLLNNLTVDDIKKFKNNAHEAAKLLCFENESTTLKEIIRS